MGYSSRPLAQDHISDEFARLLAESGGEQILERLRASELAVRTEHGIGPSGASRQARGEEEPRVWDYAATGSGGDMRAANAPGMSLRLRGVVWWLAGVGREEPNLNAAEKTALQSVGTGNVVIAVMSLLSFVALGLTLGFSIGWVVLFAPILTAAAMVANRTLCIFPFRAPERIDVLGLAPRLLFSLAQGVVATAAIFTILRTARPEGISIWVEIAVTMLAIGLYLLPLSLRFTLWWRGSSYDRRHRFDEALRMHETLIYAVVTAAIEESARLEELRSHLLQDAKQMNPQSAAQLNQTFDQRKIDIAKRVVQQSEARLDDLSQ